MLFLSCIFTCVFSGILCALWVMTERRRFREDQERKLLLRAIRKLSVDRSSLYADEAVANPE